MSQFLLSWKWFFSFCSFPEVFYTAIYDEGDVLPRCCERNLWQYYCNYCCGTFTVLWKSFSVSSDLLCGGGGYGGACAGDLFMVRRIWACLGEFFHWCPDYLLLLMPDGRAVFLATVFHSLAWPFWRLQCQNLDHTRRALWKYVTCCCPSL